MSIIELNNNSSCYPLPTISYGTNLNKWIQQLGQEVFKIYRYQPFTKKLQADLLHQMEVKLFNSLNVRPQLICDITVSNILRFYIIEPKIPAEFVTMSPVNARSHIWTINSLDELYCYKCKMLRSQNIGYHILAQHNLSCHEYLIKDILE